MASQFVGAIELFFSENSAAGINCLNN